MLSSILLAGALRASASFSSVGDSSRGVIPIVCPATTVRCVGEGASCKPDLSNLELWSIVPVCADDTLTCYHGKCVKGTRTLDQGCNPGAGQFCVWPLSCVSGSCRDTNENTGPFLARGEACTWMSVDPECAGNNVCTPARVCDLANPADFDDPARTCYSANTDCAFGEYCDTTGVCKPVLTASQKQAGASCSTNEQCGNGWYCLPRNPAETDPNLVFNACRKPYQAGEGEMCYLGMGDIDCQSGLACIQYGSTSYGFCARPDNLAGEGCENDLECGRLNTCNCPPFGGGRARCELDISIYNRNKQITQYHNMEGFWNCLEQRGCKLNSYPPPKGSCAYKYCYTADPVVPVSKCSTETGYPNPSTYKGVDLTAGASRSGPLVAVGLFLAAFLFA